MFSHPFLQSLANSSPSTLSIVLDGVEIYRAAFTNQGLKPLIERQVKQGEGSLLTFHFDNEPTPVYFLFLRSPPKIESASVDFVAF